MEGAPSSLALVEAMQARSGLPLAVVATLRHHAIVDLDHGDGLWDLIDRLPLSGAHLHVIARAAVHSMALHNTAIRGAL